MRPFVRAALCVALFAAPARARAQDRGAAALGPLVAGLGTTARVLVIGAHPDDEDTPLIAYLSRGGHARAAYLSLTRGEGGTNLVGGESGLALGVLRTEEALAARRVDGAEQFFTRAIDFGATKSADETLDRWGAKEGRDAVLGDVVTIVRGFRPHVIVSVFDSASGDGNGQHQAAGRIAREAFAAASDTVRFPADGQFGRPWTPRKLYRLARDGEPAEAETADDVLRLNVGEYNPLLGRSYAEIAAESRSRQRSQGVVLGMPGAQWVRLRLLASPTGAGSGAALFDGVDTSFARLRRAGTSAALVGTIDSLPAAIARAQAAYRPDDPSAAVTPLAGLTRLAARAAALSGSMLRGAAYDPDAARSLEDLWRRAREALVLAAGVAVEATAERETVAKATTADASDTLRVGVDVYVRGRVPVRVEAVTVTGSAAGSFATVRTDVAPDSVWHGTAVGLPRVSTGPWWLANPPLGDLYGIDVDGRSERERALGPDAGAVLAYVRLAIAGVDALVTVPVVARRVEPARGEVRRLVAAVPGITLRFNLATQYARAGVPLRRPLRITVQSAYAAERDVEVTLEVPNGLSVDTAVRRVTLPAGGARDLWFVLGGTPKAQRYYVKAIARTPGWKYGVGAATIAYEHADAQRLYFNAESVVQGVDVTYRPRMTVGYVVGAGDNVVPKLQQLGLVVTTIDPGSLALPNQDLSRFDVVAIGPRAYEASPELAATNAVLLAYVRGGGTLVVQHGQAETVQAGVLPYAMTLADPPQRVTREDAPVRVLDAGARVLAVPNRIGSSDFDGWVVDRALFMPATFDPRYRAVLATNDPGEPANRGAILVAPYGRGTYVYTTLSFFRQLAAANPGAARLFVNLLSAARTP